MRLAAAKLPLPTKFVCREDNIGGVRERMKEETQTKHGTRCDRAATSSCAEIAEQMFRLRFQMSMGQTDGLKKLRTLRKERARMLTVLRERELNPERRRRGSGGQEKGRRAK